MGSTEGTTKLNTNYNSFDEDETESISESFIQIDQKSNMPSGGQFVKKIKQVKTKFNKQNINNRYQKGNENE